MPAIDDMYELINPGAGGKNLKYGNHNGFYEIDRETETPVAFGGKKTKAYDGDVVVSSLICKRVCQVSVR